MFIKETFDCVLVEKYLSRDINVRDRDLSFCATRVTVAAFNAHIIGVSVVKEFALGFAVS